MKKSARGDTFRMHQPSAIDDLARDKGIAFSKKRGQNFLADKNMLAKILGEAALTDKDTVIEIGTGFGVLTHALCLQAGRVISYEIDNKVFESAKKLLVEQEGHANLVLHHKDFLKEDDTILQRCASPVKIVANIPFSISGHLILRLLTMPVSFERIVIMVQKEVATRICAAPGTKDYGILSVMAQAFTSPKIAFNVNRHCFVPVPNVDSCIIVFSSFSKDSHDFKQSILTLLKVVFSNRRKTFGKSIELSSLSRQHKERFKTMVRHGLIDPSLRPEQIPVETYVKMGTVLTEVHQGQED